MNAVSKLGSEDMICSLKAAVICGCIGIVAEMSYEALRKRYDQGWIEEIIDNLDVLVKRVVKAQKKKEVISLKHTLTNT